jgi:DNA-binding CsgD family transcriptional regulator
MGPIAVALLIDRGQTELARARLEHQLARVGVLSPFAARLLPLRVRLQLELGEPEAAESTAADLDRLARQLGHEHVLAMSDLVRGVVGRVRGTATAVADLETAVERYQRLGMPYDEGRAHLELAESVAPDEPELAVDEARRALKLFEPLGALRDADRAAELLRSLGASGRAGRRLPGGLSGREREVLALIEHGLSNTEIAARLFIAPKTASHHVSNVLAKLGVRTRAEAAAFAARERAAGSAVE